MLVECKSSAEEGCTNDSENTDSETSDSERLDTQKENLDSTYVKGTTLVSTASDEDFSNATSDPDITLEVPGTSDTQSKRVRRKPDRFGREFLVPTEDAKREWLTITTKNGLKYEDFSQDDKNNWYGTMGPYLDMFSAYSLRSNELRLGHNNMPITKSNGVHKSLPVSKYGLSGAHHVLLEGTSFPPERRSSIVQSLGPMTAWLGMIRSEGIYRKKYASAVKRAMSHVDEIIEITNTTRQASEIANLTTLLAEIKHSSCLSRGSW
ncbi:unnamed protein product [Arctia plantaginis]|uniref:Uncharacterized protein n=1 Tax=Arctia plantaginis TaxID=874455 RepID=A0A8S1A4E1_ARCPL|nr:unnamed protein product [Arctia plantaginis]